MSLLLRAGFIQRAACGYSYLPLGWQVMQNAAGLARKGMEEMGALEVFPASPWLCCLWEGGSEPEGTFPSARSRPSGAQRSPNNFVGKSVGELVRGLVRSYRQLPLTIFWFQTRPVTETPPARTPARTGQGLTMHAYAFARNAQELDGTYQKVADTYLRVLALLNLPGALVAADAPNPCGGLYRELAVPFPTGESKGLGCEACGYMATEDAARSGAGAPSTEVTLPLEEIQTPGAVTVEQVSQFLGVPAARLVKTIILLSDDLPVAALIRGDQELNESALRKVLGSKELRLADAQTVRQVTGGPIGFSGPVGLRVPLYVDQAVAAASNFVMGANKADTHLVNCNPGRDFNVLRVACIARARPGDKCPACPGELTTCNYMKVGHVSDILSDWSATAGATFLDSDCKTKSLAMGCFSLSPEGVVVATAERFADDSGLCWPTCVAPFQVLVSALNMDEPEVIRTAEEVHAACEAAGIRTLLDDRAESPGVKLKDADLLGIPYQAIVARRSLAQGGVEFRRRGVPDRRLIRATEVASVLRMTLSCGGQEVAHPQPG